MTSPAQTPGQAALRKQALRWWMALLAAFFLFGTFEASAATGAQAQGQHAKAAKKRPVAAKRHVTAKRHVKAKRHATARKHVKVKKHVTARKHATRKRHVAKRHTARQRLAKHHAPARPKGPQPLRVNASVAFVVDQDSGEVLLGRNASEVRSIASLTKLMTGVIVADAKLPMDERITITTDDVDTLKNSSSRLRVGTVLTREQALHLALMSSENRAAHALARTYPGGVSAFVNAMNNKAHEFGMRHTHYVEPTGLSSKNQSSARDLATLAAAAYKRPLVRKYTTSPGYELDVGDHELQYRNTNRLVRNSDWKIGLQKTGYIREAGQCLLMQTKMVGRKLIMVFLDSATKFSRIRDAENVRRWLRSHPELAGEGEGDGNG